MTSTKAAHHKELLEHLADPAVDLVKFEQDRIKGAIRTDFILSLEIIILTLGIVAAKTLLVPGTGSFGYRHCYDSGGLWPGRGNCKTG